MISNAMLIASWGADHGLRWVLLEFRD